ncbi:MAG: hypothetical protein HRT91_04220 [Piscirickettsiaceae bacterium]|nr:hypothetical protein [Piscirickettsiaceae bacterium]
MYIIHDDVLATVSGCLLGLFSAAKGHEFISVDYSDIAVVVLAALASQKWRLEVFRTRGEIYEISATKIIGIPLDYLEDRKR